jgi:hypothetical protein
MLGNQRDGQCSLVGKEARGSRQKATTSASVTKEANVTPNDLIETRRLEQKLSMRFPTDPDTTAKLRAACKVVLVIDAPLPWHRRLLRRLGEVRLTPSPFSLRAHEKKTVQ